PEPSSKFQGQLGRAVLPQTAHPRRELSSARAIPYLNQGADAAAASGPDKGVVMSRPALPPLLSTYDVERVLEFEFVRATENAALNAINWLGRGEKEKGDAAACDAIYGVFDILDIRGEVVIGEGIKDNAPGIFVGERLGTWRDGSPRFNIALDPIDGTTNLAK